MSNKISAIKIDDKITHIPLIKAELIEKELYYRRKPLRGEYTSPGAIKTGTKISGTISFRLTNDTAPLLIYIITGKELYYRHVPETRNLFQRTLTRDHENPLVFSLIEITSENCYETANLIATGFTIIQTENSPLRLEIEVDSEEEKTEIIMPEIEKHESSNFSTCRNP